MYLAILSDLQREPVFICPVDIPTEKSEINVSSVSPDLCEIIELKLLCLANSIVLIVSVTVPIWLSFIKTELPQSLSIPFFNLSVDVTNRSSPTSWHLSPISEVSALHPSQSFSSVRLQLKWLGSF